MTEEKLKELFNDIITDKLSNEELKDLFEGYNCYMTKDEFGKLAEDLFLKTTNERMKIIINSRKGDLYKDYVDEYGDSLLNLFIIKAVREEDKRKTMNTLFELLEDEELNLKWDAVNGNHENTLHIICLIANYLTKDEIMRFLNIFDKRGYNPFNKDDMNRNAFTLFKIDNKHSKEDSLEILNKMEEMSRKFIIEVDNYVEEETLVTVTSKG